MPCYITGTAEGDEKLFHDEEMTKLTQMLCETLRALEASNGKVPESVKSWWASHKKVDAKRLGSKRKG